MKIHKVYIFRYKSHFLLFLDYFVIYTKFFHIFANDKPAQDGWVKDFNRISWLKIPFVRTATRKDVFERYYL